MIIPETQVVIGCAGLTAIGEMIQEVCFRSEFLERIRKDGKVTEQLLAEILCSESGTRKNVGKRAYRILLNQLDGSREKGAAEQTAKWIDQWSQKNGKETVTIAASCYLHTKD